MKKLLVSTLGILLVFSSCDKDKDDCTTDVAGISGTYKLVAASSTLGGITTDEYAALDACEKDDLYILAANGTLTYQDAGTVCNPSSSYSSTWSLNGNTITIDGETSNIQSYNCDNLNLNVSGVGFSATATFKRQ